MAISYFANPYHGNINPSDSTGLKLFQSATAERDDSDKLACKISISKEFIESMKADSVRFGWGLLIDVIPFGEQRLSILQDFDDLDVDGVREYTSPIFYDPTDPIPNGYTTNLCFDINPSTSATDRKVFFNRVRANMIGSRILGSLDKNALKSLKVHSGLYTWKTTEGETLLDGPTMLQILVSKCKPSTRVGVTGLKAQIRSIKLSSFGYNVSDMLEHMKGLKNEVEELGHTHDDMIRDMFNALETGKNEIFSRHIESLKTKWEGGYDYTIDELSTESVTKYNNLSEAKAWRTAPDAKDAKIVALTTQLNELTDKINNRSGQTKSGDTKKSISVDEWRKSKSLGEHTKRDGKDWYWCPHQHNNGKGLYVTHKPENHVDWKEKKRQKTSNNSNGNSNGNQQGKLSLNDKLKAAMMTKFKCSATDAAALLKDCNEESGN
jgi:hypothetical protein